MEHHRPQRRKGLVLSAVIALALATFAVAPATTPATKAAPTLHDVQLDGVATSWTGVAPPIGGPTCRTMAVTHEGEAIGDQPPKRSRFTSITSVTFGPFDPVQQGEVPVADLRSTIELKMGSTRAVVRLFLGEHEVLGRCTYSPGGESGRASGTVGYAATFTGPHGIVNEVGTATIEISAGQGHAPTDPLFGSINVQFH